MLVCQAALRDFLLSFKLVVPYGHLFLFIASARRLHRLRNLLSALTFDVPGLNFILLDLGLRCIPTLKHVILQTFEFLRVT